MADFEQHKALYKCVFHDSPTFVDAFFDTIVTNNNTFSIIQNGIVVASLQMFEYVMKYSASEVKCGYIYAVMTHPDYRNRGFMRQLLQTAITEAKHRKYAFVFLVEQDQLLHNTYSRFGFKSTFAAERYEILVEPYENNDVVEITIDQAFELYNTPEQNTIVATYEMFAFQCKQVLAEGGVLLTTQIGNKKAWALIANYHTKLYVVATSGDKTLQLALISKASYQLGINLVSVPRYNSNKKHGMALIISQDISYKMLDNVFVGLLMEE